MKQLIEFIDKYYEKNLEFNQENFLNVINILITELEKFENSQGLNSVLEKILSEFSNKDYYSVMQIIEYELLPRLIKKESVIH
ncbi:MAG: hypothetical protein SCL54_12140 [Bacillota bacterium]|nr:hypothetical protein [Bacillota bacterium]